MIPITDKALLVVCSVGSYLVVSSGDVCTDGTHKCSDVVHKAVWETLTPGNVQFGGQE